MRRPIFIVLLSFSLPFFLASEITHTALIQIQNNDIRTLKLREVMRIDDGDDFFFQTPLQTIVAPDGSIIVNEGNKLYRFNSQGEYIDNLFEEGEGPGEMKQIGNVLILANRTLTTDIESACLLSRSIPSCHHLSQLNLSL